MEYLFFHLLRDHAKDEAEKIERDKMIFAFRVQDRRGNLVVENR